MKTFLLKEMTVFSNWKSMFLEMEARLMASTKPHTAHSLIIPYPLLIPQSERICKCKLFSMHPHAHTLQPQPGGQRDRKQSEKDPYGTYTGDL